ncbi:MAG TPA: hypothetical protein VK642_09680 [Burkholderiales bacterium]|nr:hypothetical protein [Burkholderiales bacterium]
MGINMTPIETRLKEIAVQIALRLYDEGKIAAFELANAQWVLNDARTMRDAVVSEALRADIGSPAQETARQAEKDLAEATVALGKLEVIRDYGIHAKMRAFEYVPMLDKRGYTCPECWVKEQLDVTMESNSQDALGKELACPSCSLVCTFSLL